MAWPRMKEADGYYVCFFFLRSHKNTVLESYFIAQESYLRSLQKIGLKRKKPPYLLSAFTGKKIKAELKNVLSYSPPIYFLSV